MNVFRIANLPHLWRWLEPPLNVLQSPASLLARCYVAQVFFLSGLTKLRDWDTTLALFMDEYHVPLLSPTVAAWMGTCAEIVLPVLLVLGLGGRIAALGHRAGGIGPVRFGPLGARQRLAGAL